MRKKATAKRKTNFLKKLHNSPALKRIKKKRTKLESQLKKLGREYKSTVKKVSRKLAKKK